MHWGWDWGGGLGMFGGMFIWLIIIIGVIVAAVFGLFNLGNRATNNGKDYHDGGTPRNALEILKERYVKGEISEEEFKKMRETLLD